MLSIQHRHRGLTLAEAILVIGLLTVFTTISSSALIRTRRTSRAIACMSNLKQISTALQMYHADTGYIALPRQPALPVTLAQYVTDEAIFVCPASPYHTSDSYSRSYVPRSPTEPNGFLLGCANHGKMDMSTATFGPDNVTRGTTAAVKWNGAPVAISAEVEGGVLRFADGTSVTIKPGLKVVILASFDEGGGKTYSAIRIPDGAYGSIDVNAAHDTHFDVATPTCTTGVKGTKFTVTTSRSLGELRTRVSVIEGVAAVNALGATPTQALLRPGDSESFVLPSNDTPLLADLTVAGPFFRNGTVIYGVTNDTGELRRITSIRIGWPAANSRLRQIYFGSAKILHTNLHPSSTLITSSWFGHASGRQIMPGATKELRFEFKLNADTTTAAGKYAIRLLSHEPEDAFYGD